MDQMAGLDTSKGKAIPNGDFNACVSKPSAWTIHDARAMASSTCRTSEWKPYRDAEDRRGRNLVRWLAEQGLDWAMLQDGYKPMWANNRSPATTP